jgi:hypothetical protein
MNPLTQFKKTPILSPLIALALVAVAPAAAVLPPGNTVQQWNRIAEDMVVGSGTFQPEGVVYMAYVSAAVYDADQRELVLPDTSAGSGRLAPDAAVRAAADAVGRGNAPICPAQPGSVPAGPAAFASEPRVGRGLQRD